MADLFAFQNRQHSGHYNYVLFIGILFRRQIMYFQIYTEKRYYSSNTPGRKTVVARTEKKRRHSVSVEDRLFFVLAFLYIISYAKYATSIKIKA